MAAATVFCVAPCALPCIWHAAKPGFASGPWGTLAQIWTGVEASTMLWDGLTQPCPRSQRDWHYVTQVFLAFAVASWDFWDVFLDLSS